MRHSSATQFSPSVDGYVRLPEQALADLHLVHIDSAPDPDLLDELRAEGVDASSAGYTEWQRPRGPGGAHVTLGWDWYVDRASGALVVAWGDIRSNVMCVDPHGFDLGPAQTTRALLRCVAGLNWPNAVAQAALAPWGQPSLRGPTLQ
ncbi:MULTISPECIES: DUF4902 domain-containing protein [unclassified Trinickia]|jgi:hypothetical protein|uniref:DUF4902 domain-containing protein n=1 Tax=unclassified Trinickia TaxID=2638168 RepID=UPI002404AA8B|nr:MULTISPECIES: DUF4902 domain-containing protein [unclassified Trinickia]MDG0025785.1 DUF4902 domain-containing protein [Trinickia sp. Y13]HVW50166.1 DUF4902 domain-containing protein [Trinickia sp.]